MAAPDEFPAPSAACPKCGAPMAQGFVRDLSGQVGQLVGSSAWIEGTLQLKRFLGVPFVRIRRKNRLEYSIVAFRCGTCGYLELYTRPDESPSRG